MSLRGEINFEELSGILTGKRLLNSLARRTAEAALVMTVRKKVRQAEIDAQRSRKNGAAAPPKSSPTSVKAENVVVAKASPATAKPRQVPVPAPATPSVRKEMHEEVIMSTGKEKRGKSATPEPKKNTGKVADVQSKRNTGKAIPKVQAPLQAVARQDQAPAAPIVDEKKASGIMALLMSGRGRALAGLARRAQSAGKRPSMAVPAPSAADPQQSTQMDMVAAKLAETLAEKGCHVEKREIDGLPVLVGTTPSGESVCFTVDPDGTTSLDFDGFEGDGCERFKDRLNARMAEKGLVVASEKIERKTGRGRVMQRAEERRQSCNGR